MMSERFLPVDYQYKMNIEHKQEDDTVHHPEPDHINNVFDECLQLKQYNLLDVEIIEEECEI